MYLQKWNTILEQKNAAQKAVLKDRKYQLSNKRQVIDRKHLMTEIELVGL